MANRIQLDGDGYILEEALAAAAVNPGNLIEKIAAGTVQKHSEEGGYGLVAVAVEDALQGNDDDDQYASGARVIYHIQRRGTRFRALLKAGENVTIGQALISDGAGRLIAQTSRASDSATKQIMAWAEAASDLSAGGAVDTLLSVRAG